jgi:hypothetical protein
MQTSLPEAKARELDDLDARVGSARWVVPTFMVIVGAVFFVATHAGLVWMNQYLSRADGALIVLLPQTAIWRFFPGFGALAFSYEITLQIWTSFAGAAVVQNYNRWSMLKSTLSGGRYAGLDGRKALRWLSVVVAMPIGALTILALPMHAALKASAIRDCGYGFTTCRIYPYGDAVRMTTIQGFRNRDGKLTRRAGIVLDFRDGRRWSSADWGNFRDSVDPTLTRYLTERVPLSMNYAESDADLPPVGNPQVQ